MESYEDLRLKKKDKIPKLSLFERLFKRDSNISEQNLDFLEERYQKSDSTLQNLEQESQDLRFVENPIFESPIEEDLRYQENLHLQKSLKENLQKDFGSGDFKIDSQKEDLLLLDDLILESEHLRTLAQEQNPNLQDLELQNLQALKPTSLNTDEREEVLSGIDLNVKEIPFKMVLITFCVMTLVLTLFVPKIYIRNNIYYASRNIIQLQAQIDSLSEENKHIKKQLEDIKFKNLTQELDF